MPNFLDLFSGSGALATSDSGDAYEQLGGAGVVTAGSGVAAPLDATHPDCYYFVNYNTPAACTARLKLRLYGTPGVVVFGIGLRGATPVGDLSSAGPTGYNIRFVSGGEGWRCRKHAGFSESGVGATYTSPVPADGDILIVDDDGATNPTFTARLYSASSGTTATIGTWTDTSSPLAAGGRLWFRWYSTTGGLTNTYAADALWAGTAGGPTVTCVPDTTSIGVGGGGHATGVGTSGFGHYTATDATKITVDSSTGAFTGAATGTSSIVFTGIVFPQETATSSAITVTGGATLTGGTIGTATGVGTSTFAIPSSALPSNVTGTAHYSWEYNNTSPVYGGTWGVLAGKTAAALSAVTGATPATTYYVRRKVVDDASATAYSNVATVTTLALPSETVPVLDHFTQTQVFGSAPAVNTGGTSPYTYQWYRSALNADTPTSLGGTAVLLSGQTGTSFTDTPGRPPDSQGGVWYYSRVVTDANGATARSPQDLMAPLADHPRVSIVFYGTSLVYAYGQADPTAAPFECARMLSRINGIRWVDALNCGQGASAAADWLTSAAPGANLAGGPSASLNYYQWMTQNQIPAWLTATGVAGPDYFLIMHETNDGGVSPSSYQSSMQSTITALHGLYPSAKFCVSDAPVTHLGNENLDQGNNLIAAKRAATAALAAANPGLVYRIGADLYRYTAFHPEERDLTTNPQPANQIHYGPQGRVSIGTAWAAGLANVIDGTTTATTPGRPAVRTARGR
jgi:hypothetical protein